MADSWKPEDKATESAFENPAEFDISHPTTEASKGPIASGEPKTHGEARNPKDG